MKKKAMIAILLSVVVIVLVALCIYFIQIFSTNSEYSENTTATEKTTKMEETSSEKSTSIADKKQSLKTVENDKKYGAEYEKVWESEDGVIRFVIDSNKCKSRSGIHEGTYSYEFESSYVSVYLNDFRDRGGPYDEGYACVFKDIYEEGFPDDPDSQYLGEHTYLAGYYKISKDDKSFTVTVSDMEENLKYNRPKDSIESKYKNGDKVVFRQVSE